MDSRILEYIRNDYAFTVRPSNDDPDIFYAELTPVGFAEPEIEGVGTSPLEAIEGLIEQL